VIIPYWANLYVSQLLGRTCDLIAYEPFFSSLTIFFVIDHVDGSRRKEEGVVEYIHLGQTCVDGQ
jgi:hypothetical protein